MDGQPVFRAALCYGFRNIQGLVRRMRLGTCPYDYVEVMACPSGEGGSRAFHGVRVSMGGGGGKDLHCVRAGDRAVRAACACLVLGSESMSFGLRLALLLLQAA